MEEQKHWAQSLKKGSKVFATLRHKTDGTQNRHNVLLVVNCINIPSKTINAIVYGQSESITVDFCNLTPLGCKEFPKTIEPKIDRSTLPKDGQEIFFQDEDENWHEGYFSGGDDLFFVNEGHWYSSWTIICWCDVSDVKYVPAQ